MTAPTTHASPLTGAGDPATGRQDMKKPKATAPENERALYWRTAIAKISRRELAALTGFSESTILDIERGHNRGTGKTIDPQVMKRYRLACAAAWTDLEFDWEAIHISPRSSVKIKIGD